MVLVAAAPDAFRLFLPGFEHLGTLGEMNAFWIDRDEVTNAEYKRFVDAGAYRRREFAQDPFVEDGKAVDWEHAMARLVDSTGPGPGRLDSGRTAGGRRSPAGHGSELVRAASVRALCRQAAADDSSLGARGRAAVCAVGGAVQQFRLARRRSGRRPTGAPHLWRRSTSAGNVKEWTSTDSGDGRRYILGGAWDEPIYTFNDPDVRALFDRGRTFGFRSVTYPTAPAATLLAPLPWLTRDYTREQPASDAVFEIYRRVYAYDRQPFTAKTLATAEIGDDVRRETVLIPAAYGAEQMKVFLFLPKRGTAPFETVILFPGSNVFRTRSIDQFPLINIDFLVKSGRAVAFPELKGTFDRQTGLQDSTANASVTYQISHRLGQGREPHRGLPGDEEGHLDRPARADWL